MWWRVRWGLVLMSSSREVVDSYGLKALLFYHMNSGCALTSAAPAHIRASLLQRSGGTVMLKSGLVVCSTYSRSSRLSSPSRCLSSPSRQPQMSPRFICM